MKTAVKFLLIATIIASLLLCGACTKKGEGADTTDKATTADISNNDPSVVGTWCLPESDWTFTTQQEYWVLGEDGSFAHLQTSEDGKEVKTEGTYTAENGKLIINYSGFTLPEYTYVLTDANTMIRSDHGDDVTLTRKQG